MSTDTVTASRPAGSRVNLALLATIVIPAFAILASVGTVGIALLEGDSELPEQYHWEGFKLERDFERFERAVALDVRATLTLERRGSRCTVALAVAGAPPSALELALVHGTRKGLDQHVKLTRAGGRYIGSCKAVQAGPWRIELSDAAGGWSVRQQAFGALEHVAIAARAGTP